MQRGRMKSEINSVVAQNLMNISYRSIDIFLSSSCRSSSHTNKIQISLNFAHVLLIKTDQKPSLNCLLSNFV